MGISNDQREKEEKERKDKEARDKVIKSLEILNKKIKEKEMQISAKEKQAASLKEEAAKCLKSGNKDKAKKILKKKKMIDNQVINFNNQLNMMEDQVMQLENAINLREITKAIKGANEVIKENQVSVEDLHEQVDIMNDLKDQTDEVNQAFADYNNENDIDIEKELAQCEDELRKEVALPSANTEELNSDGIKNKVKKNVNLASY